MQTTSRAVRSQNLKKLLRKVEVSAEGSPELEREIARVFPSAPADVSRSIDALVKLIETELPGWWWTCGFCKLSDDASLYPPGPTSLHMPRLGRTVLPDPKPSGSCTTRRGVDVSTRAFTATPPAAVSRYRCCQSSQG